MLELSACVCAGEVRHTYKCEFCHRSYFHKRNSPLHLASSFFFFSFLLQRGFFFKAFPLRVHDRHVDFCVFLNPNIRLISGELELDILVFEVKLAQLKPEI